MGFDLVELEEEEWDAGEKMMRQLNLNSTSVKIAFQSAIDWAAEMARLHSTDPDDK